MTSDTSDSHNRGSRFRKYISRIFKKPDEKNFATSNSTFDIATCENLESSKQEMIRGIISLSSKNAREIMIPRVDVVAVHSGISLKELVKIVDNAGHSRIPVYNTTIDNITGILYVKNLLNFIIQKPQRFDLKKILHKPYFVPETMPLDDLLVEFKRRQLHLACIVDEYGGFGGIVTLEDILEEIVGEIKDEFDDDELPELKKVGKNAYEVDSRMTISDFNESTGAHLPTEEFDTIGGLVLDLFGKIPVKNDIVRHENISFKIKAIKGTRLSRITVTITQP